jgi:hypothetical protein
MEKTNLETLMNLSLSLHGALGSIPSIKNKQTNMKSCHCKTDNQRWKECKGPKKYYTERINKLVAGYLLNAWLNSILKSKPEVFFL